MRSKQIGKFRECMSNVLQGSMLRTMAIDAPDTVASRPDAKFVVIY